MRSMYCGLLLDAAFSICKQLVSTSIEAFVLLLESPLPRVESGVRLDMIEDLS